MIRIKHLFILFFLVFIYPSVESQENTSHKISYFLPNFWENIFNPESKDAVFYNLEPTIRLHQVAKEAGYDLRIADSIWNCLRDGSGRDPEYPDRFDYVIAFDFFNFQFDYLSKYPKEKMVLILWEPPATLPVNYETHYHHAFSRIYTWKDDLIDNKKYFKIYYPVLKPMIKDLIDFDEKKCCIMVAGNKTSWLPNEIYTERRHLIDFFENEHPSDLDLFGGDWPTTYKVLKGKISGGPDKKIETMKSYKFAIAYENTKDIPGYISEKIFHCFQAGVVPIYWGASNITFYIPKNCFIDRREFKDNQALYDFLKSMSKDTYMEYIRNIQTFLGSEEAQLFSSDHFIKTMMDFISNPPLHPFTNHSY